MKTTGKLLILGMMLSTLAMASGTEVKIGVNGMVCGFCAQGITKKFKAENAVESVDVKLSEKKVTLILREKQDLPDDRIKQILTDSGFNVQKIERQGI